MTTVTTNGMLYPKYAAEQLVGKVDALLFASIDSTTDPDTHDRIRAMKSCSTLALERPSPPRASLRQSLYVSHVVTNESFPHVDEMIRFAKDQKAILYLNPCFSFFGNEGLDKEKAKALSKYFGKPGVIVDRAQLELISSGGNKVEDPVCRAVTSTVVISPENKLLLPCYHFKEEALPINGKLYVTSTRTTRAYGTLGEDAWRGDTTSARGAPSTATCEARSSGSTPWRACCSPGTTSGSASASASRATWLPPSPPLHQGEPCPRSPPDGPGQAVRGPRGHDGRGGVAAG